MLGASGVLVQPVADPGLLIGDGVTVWVAGSINSLARRCPVVDDNKTGIASCQAIVKGVTHAGKIATHRGRAAAVGGSERLAEALCLWEVGLECRDCIAI